MKAPKTKKSEELKPAPELNKALAFRTIWSSSRSNREMRCESDSGSVMPLSDSGVTLTVPDSSFTSRSR